MIKTTVEKPNKDSDFYSVLGIDITASNDEIRRAYKKAANDCHPDKPKGDAEIFKRVRQAYETLIDPVKRAEYDATFGIETDNNENMKTAVNIIKKEIAAVILDEDIDLAYFNFQRHLEGIFKKNIKTCRKGIIQINKEKKRIKRYRGRAKGPLLKLMFSQTLDKLEVLLAETESTLAIQELALELAKTCGYEYDEKPSPATPPWATFDPFEVK